MNWLNKNPIFYNIHTLKYSENINDVIDYDIFDWDYDGLKNYLDYGYCVFGHTPIKDVRFTQANETLRITPTQLDILIEKDPFIETLESEKNTHPDDIHHWMRNYLTVKFNTMDGICLPLSGGYDSRYIAAMLAELNYQNVHAFTFGISKKQSESFEVVRAKQIALRLNIPWKRIQIQNVFDYVNDWYELFGNSTHLHGHHQVDFYKQIVKNNGIYKYCLSGLVGDAWNGKVSIEKIQSPKDLIRLGFNHGLSASSKFQRIQIKSNFPAEVYFEKDKHNLEHPNYRIVAAMRMKMMLLRYLEVVPNDLGMKTHSPFTEIEYVSKAFGLAEDYRINRKWQEDFFRGRKLMPEDTSLNESRRWEAQEYYFLRESKEPLDVNLLYEIYDPARIDWVNKHICNTFSDRLNLKLNLPFRGRRFLLPFISKSQHKGAFSEYYTLWPLQKLIERRNTYLKSNGIT